MLRNPDTSKKREGTANKMSSSFHYGRGARVGGGGKGKERGRVPCVSKPQPK